ncbi:flavin reductase family protein [Streptomyces sp. AM 4-1-1]|uniref:flavin reductase family protein n=1 Tax=Streptomyces sp. AM 4-1-1 TaxID=3028710 RepID=UPI0023B90400|nr:flavin reductase family protein [Streptomyces sp. AM 4-1-1]WEH33836.1 flavin reductase family protein [Streptomyces sp. AM 4-1-1]
MVILTADETTADRDVFRALMGSHPSGVTVITTSDDQGTPHGFTCTALCSVSLRPPQLLVCASNSGSTLPVITARGAFAVNFLHSAGRRAAEAFAGPVAERFTTVPWEPAPATGLPVLPQDAHAIAECRVTQLASAGDHTVVIGEVLHTHLPGPADADAPLLYVKRRYATWPS